MTSWTHFLRVTSSLIVVSLLSGCAFGTKMSLKRQEEGSRSSWSRLQFGQHLHIRRDHAAQTSDEQGTADQKIV